MISIKDFMEVIRYRINEGSEYGWDCFGSNAYSFSSWDGDHNGSSFNMVFDTVTQTVYCVEACDYKNNRAYRLINPDFVKAYRKEAKDNTVSADQAWDDINFIDLDVDEDFLQKARAIVNGETYDLDVLTPLVMPDIPEESLFKLMQIAHERNITLNKLVEEILNKEIAAVK